MTSCCTPWLMAVTDAVYVKGRVLLANTTLHPHGSFHVLSMTPDAIAAAKAYFGDDLKGLSQRELINLKPCFKPDIFSPAAVASMLLDHLTRFARAAAVPERCRWPGCEESRYADSKEGEGRRLFGMYKHLCVHAADAARSPEKLEAAALLHAATACGLCGSSSAGCVIKCSPKNGRDHIIVLCQTPPFSYKTPPFKTPKAGPPKNAPFACGHGGCKEWVWLYARRSHYALRHAGVDLPPHALNEAGFLALQKRDRVKPPKPVDSAGRREKRRQAAAAKRSRMADAAGNSGAGSSAADHGGRACRWPMRRPIPAA